MAIVTAVNRPRGQTRGGLRAVLRYVMKEEKTADQDRHLVTGVNCQADSCCTEFISTKLQYGKDGGRMYYHFVQSFHPEEAVTPEACEVESVHWFSVREILRAMRENDPRFCLREAEFRRLASALPFPVALAHDGDEFLF